MKSQIFLDFYNAEKALEILTKEQVNRKVRNLWNATKIENKYFWEMRNSEKIDVTKMSDSHLANTINFLKRIIKDQDFIDATYYGDAAQGWND